MRHARQPNGFVLECYLLLPNNEINAFFLFALRSYDAHMLLMVFIWACVCLFTRLNNKIKKKKHDAFMSTEDVLLVLFISFACVAKKHVFSILPSNWTLMLRLSPPSSSLLLSLTANFISFTENSIFFHLATNLNARIFIRLVFDFDRTLVVYYVCLFVIAVHSTFFYAIEIFIATMTKIRLTSKSSISNEWWNIFASNKKTKMSTNNLFVYLFDAREQ